MADDIVTKLRNRYPDVVHAHLLADAELVGAAAAEIERLRAVLDDIADLHEPSSVLNPGCHECGEWPCRTHLIVCSECRESRRGR